jgi:hypothetical protein
MLARVITLRFDPVIGSFDDSPLREFLKDKEVLSIRPDDLPIFVQWMDFLAWLLPTTEKMRWCA